MPIIYETPGDILQQKLRGVNQYPPFSIETNVQILQHIYTYNYLGEYFDKCNLQIQS